MLRRSQATASASAPSCNLAKPTNMHPPEGGDIAGRETERLVDMGLGFRAATQKKLGQTDERVRAGQISIQRQRPLAFSNALGRAVRKNLDDAQDACEPRHAAGRWTEP